MRLLPQEKNTNPKMAKHAFDNSHGNLEHLILSGSLNFNPTK